MPRTNNICRFPSLPDSGEERSVMFLNPVSGILNIPNTIGGASFLWYTTTKEACQMDLSNVNRDVSMCQKLFRSPTIILGIEITMVL